MHRKPLHLLFASLVLMYLPLELIWRTSQSKQIVWVEWVVSFVFPVILLVGLLRVTRVGWYTLMACLALWGVHDLYRLYSASGQHSQLFIHLAIYVFSLSYFINPRVRTLYFDPKLHWWKAKPRFATSLPMILQRDTMWFYPMLRNVSEGGCFIETNATFVMGDRVELSIPLPVPLAVSVIQAEGEVRWVSSNPLRRGMGVRFINPPADQATAIRQFVRLQL